MACAMHAALFHAAATAFTSPQLVHTHRAAQQRCCIAVSDQAAADVQTEEKWLTEKTVLLHAGSPELPPLVQIPGGDTLPLLK